MTIEAAKVRINEDKSVTYLCPECGAEVDELCCGECGSDLTLPEVEVE